MKKLVISKLLACACFGAGLSSEVKGYIEQKMLVMMKS